MSKNNITTMYQQTITLGGSTAVFNTFNSQPQPTAHITKSRGRLKAYGNTVYLKTGSNFEIELFNPKTTQVLAKIMVNGQWLSEAGIILKPGQRVYLERFIDVAKKLVFETYEVEDSAEAKAAIANNGKIKVFFYDEISPSWNSNSGTANWQLYPSTITYASGPATFTSSIGASVNYCNSSAAGSFETGRVEQGSNSKQEFSNGYGNFSDWASVTSEWQILPESKKPVEMGEIRSYCTGCGTRHKKSSWKFCPNCGTSASE
jgi:hypothetical protein